MSGRRRPRAQKRAGRAGKPRTLRTRLVVASVVLIAVVCSVIGTVTTLALRSHLYDQLSGKLNEASSRAAPRDFPPGKFANGANGDGDDKNGQLGAQANQQKTPATFVIGPGPDGTIAAKLENGKITDAKRGVNSGSDQNFGMTAEKLTAAQIKVLNTVPKDNKQHKVELPGIGDYLVRYSSNDTSAYYVALPTTDVDATIDTLILVEISVTAAGLGAAVIAGYVLVGLATRPCAGSPTPPPGSPNSRSTPARST